MSEEGAETRPFVLSLSAGLLIAGFICVAALHASVITCAYGLLCLYALAGPKQAIKALSLSYLMLLLNPAFHELPQVTSILRWVIILVAGLRVFAAIPVRSYRFLVPLLLFFAMVSVLALPTSSSFAVSFLKIAIFTFFSATVLAAFNSLDRSDLEELRRWFLTIAVVVVLLSLPTLAVPKIGFLVNGTGFQGILDHPQTLGIFLAPVAAYLGARLLLRNGPPPRMEWGIWGIVMGLMLLSRARTAALAFFLSLGVTLFTGSFSARKASLGLAGSRALVSVLILSMVLAAGVLASPTLSKMVVGFVLKGETGGIGEAFYQSRGSGISFFWSRFLQAPFTGHGFGIDASHDSVRNTNTFLGIPIGSSTEFGFLPAAFLEQVGILGLAFFLPFFVFLLRRSIRQADIGLTAMFFACLFVNIGEAVFFSPGQDGGYQWLLIGLCTAAGWQTQSFRSSDSCAPPIARRLHAGAGLAEEELPFFPL